MSDTGTEPEGWRCPICHSWNKDGEPGTELTVMENGKQRTLVVCSICAEEYL